MLFVADGPAIPVRISITSELGRLLSKVGELDALDTDAAMVVEATAVEGVA